MTPYELRFEIFKTALSIAEGECFYQRELKETFLSKGVDEKLLQFYIEDYPKYPSLEQIEKIAKQINTFVSEQS